MVDRIWIRRMDEKQQEIGKTASKIIYIMKIQWEILPTDNSLYQIITIDNIQMEAAIVQRLTK